ncbi:Cytochrome P450 [Dillenia turbinata]|uniref:Cytochrome P450 n=1 Tax=Dillenia turbinata TaxID=194707 RepID=A0AAN8UYA8_9MAGN
MATMILITCFLLITWWGAKMFCTIWRKPKMIEKRLKQQGIHGHPYKLLYGSAKEIMKFSKESVSKPKEQSHDILPHLNPLIENLVATYKDKFVVWYGTTPRVTLTDPKLVKEVMSDISGEFPKPRNANIDYFVTGVASYRGEKWAKHRKIILPAFHIEKLKKMLPAFSLCASEMVEKWDKLAGQNGSCELDVWPEFQNLTGNAISRAAFSSSFEDGRLIFQLQKEQARLYMKSLYYIKFPWSRCYHLPNSLLAHLWFSFLCSALTRFHDQLYRFFPTTVNRRMREIHKQVGSLLECMIKKREEAIKLGNSNKEDLLDLLLRSSLAEIQESKNLTAGLSTKDVIEECKLFYFVGQESTGTLLSWTLICLSMHQNWQTQTREEILKIIGKNKPSFNDLIEMNTVHMILLEVLRLYPPISVLRCVEKETQLGDLSLPKGIQLYMPFYVIHRDPKHWGEDAMEFNPDRFSEGLSKASKDETSYFPFGWGPRNCIGQNFSLLQAKLVLVIILQHFWFELSASYIHVALESITLCPKYGAQIIFHRI